MIPTGIVAGISSGTESNASGPGPSATGTQLATGQASTGASGGRLGQGAEAGPLRSARAAVLVYFVIMGLAEGIWIARIPGAKERLHLADGLLGASLLVGPAGLVLVMPLAGRLTDRFGSTRVIWPAGLTVAVLPLALWSAQTLPAVLGSVLAFGIAGGALTVALNAQGVRLERRYGRPLMASFHASYSLGGLAGALLGGLLAWRRAAWSARWTASSWAA